MVQNDGPFPKNEISLFVKTGETSVIRIATYPLEEAREAGGKIRDDLHNNSEMAFKVKEIVPLGGPVLIEFIDGVLSPQHNPKWNQHLINLKFGNGLSLVAQPSTGIDKNWEMLTDLG